MGKLKTFTRRAFLIGSTAIAGGVAFGAYKYRQVLHNPLEANLGSDEAAITPYVKVTRDGIELITPRADKGQGAYSVQAHLIAEELDVDPHKITVNPGMPSHAYYNGAVLQESTVYPSTDMSWIAERSRAFKDVPAKLLGMQMTGGSSTVPDSYEKLRMAGAIARETLKEAAARSNHLNRSELSTDDGHVILPDGTCIPYTQLATAAAKIQPIGAVTLRSPDQWKYVGKRHVRRIDMTRKCTGTEQYGIDLKFEGMLHASVRANPGLGGKVKRIDSSAAENMRGVLAVVNVKGGVAVVANNTWRAIKAVNAIDIEFERGPMPVTQAEIWQTLESSFNNRPNSKNKDNGDVDTALAADVDVIEAEYRVPYLAHAPLEPMNAIVRVSDDKCEIWTGTQIPGFVQSHAASLVGLPKQNVFVYAQPMGGSFGRRLEDTYVLQAVEIAMTQKNVPIKMTWSREEDMTHDYPRPAQIGKMRGIVVNNKVDTYDIAISSSSVMGSWISRLIGFAPPGADVSIVAGAWDQPFDIPNYRVTGYKAPEMVPISTWRSVGNSGVGFMHGGFLDELFDAAGVDPMDELIKLCTHEHTSLVLEEIKTLSGWDGRDMGKNRGRGVAFTNSFGVPTAEVVEVTNTEQGIRIDNVYVVCEVGTVIDPINLDAQLMGGVIFGLGHAMNCELTYEDQKPQQTNYHAFEAMRMYQTPKVTVKALENSERVRGIGEPAVPPAAAALANAIFAATGKRIREMPMNKHVEFI